MRIAWERAEGVRLTRLLVEVAPSPDSYIEGRAPSTEAVHALLATLVRDPHFARHKAEWGGVDEQAVLFGLRGPVHVHYRVTSIEELGPAPPPGLADILNALKIHDAEGRISRRSQLRMLRTVHADRLWRQTLYDFDFDAPEKEAVAPAALFTAIENVEAHLPLFRSVRLDVTLLDGNVRRARARFVVYHPPR
jgi:hypothetical protein